MRFHPLTAACAFAAGLLLSACDSSSTSADTNPKDTSIDGKANGTVTLGGKAVPVSVSGLYDDSGMMLTANTALDEKTDTGWSFIVNALPGKGTHPILEDTATLLGNTATHDPGEAGASCIYHFVSGSLHIDAWTEKMLGQYRTAKMSGGASITLEPSGATPACAGFTTQLTFTDADAANLGGD